MAKNLSKADQEVEKVVKIYEAMLSSKVRAMVAYYKIDNLMKSVEFDILNLDCARTKILNAHEIIGVAMMELEAAIDVIRTR